MTGQHLESKIKFKSPDPKDEKLYSSASSLDDEEKGQPQQLKDEILKILDGLDKEEVRSKEDSLRKEKTLDVFSLEDDFVMLVGTPQSNKEFSKEWLKAVFDLKLMPCSNLISSLHSDIEEEAVEDQALLYLHKLFILLKHRDAIILALIYQQLTPEDWLRLLQQPTHQDDTVRPDFKRAISLHLLAEQPDPSIIISFLSKSVSEKDWEALLFTLNAEGRTPLQEYVLKGNIKALEALRGTVSDAAWKKLVNYGGTTGTSSLYSAVDRVRSLQPSESKTAFRIIKYLRTYGGDAYQRILPTALPNVMELFRAIEGELRAASVTNPSAAVMAFQLSQSLLTNIELALEKILSSPLLLAVMKGDKTADRECFYIKREIKQSDSTPFDLREWAYEIIQTLTTFYPATKKGEFGDGIFFGEAYSARLTTLIGFCILPEDPYPSPFEIPLSEITLELTPAESQELCALLNLIQRINQQIAKRITTPHLKLDTGFDEIVYSPKQTAPSPATRVAIVYDAEMRKDDGKSLTKNITFFPSPPSSTSSQPAIFTTTSSDVSSNTQSVVLKKKRKREGDSSAPSSLSTSSPSV